MASASEAFTISGCLVKWRQEGKVYNTGYIEHWAQNRLEQWDMSIERKAGGLDQDIIMSGQHLTLSNMSSLLALIATVVKQFLQTGTVEARLARAFKAIRVSLVWMAAGQDVELLNARENIEQEERKRHTELDNTMPIQQWMNIIDAAKILDPNVALDVFKFGSVLGDPRKPVQPWLA